VYGGCWPKEYGGGATKGGGCSTVDRASGDVDSPPADDHQFGTLAQQEALPGIDRKGREI
jgi:hypothetical protein